MANGGYKMPGSEISESESFHKFFDLEFSGEKDCEGGDGDRRVLTLDMDTLNGELMSSYIEQVQLSDVSVLKNFTDFELPKFSVSQQKKFVD